MVVGGVAGAAVAMVTAVSGPASPSRQEPAASTRTASPPLAAPTPAVATATAFEAPSAAAAEPPAASTIVSATTVTAEPQAAASSAPAPAFVATPPLLLPITREALLTAELYCDKRRDFDECERAAAVLEAGSVVPPDAQQAKRFRRIALTHLVTQCEAASPHACFVMAGKFRAGTELTLSPARAEALEKRGLELCRLGRSAPECPPPTAP
jgi:hypothetical protein